MGHDERHAALLSAVGARVRAERRRKALSRRELAQRSGVSERFLAQLEAGRGNISLARFADVAEALATTPSALLEGASGAEQAVSVVALLGVRGAGKSSVGSVLAARFAVPFVEVDEHVERAAGLALSEIFALHGEAYYRRVEREVLTDLLERSQPAVLATGGSIVTDTDSYGLLRARARTVWLRARAEEHWERVIRQGDERPMGRNPHAFAELEALLETRAALYGDADHVVDTSDRSIAQVAELVADAVAEVLQAPER